MPCSSTRRRAATHPTMSSWRTTGGMDLVFNLTPAPLHRDITARALEAGYNVYSEKPIAASLQEAAELSEIADAKGLKLFVAPSTTTTARMLYIKQRIDNGDFGHAHTIKAHIGGDGAGRMAGLLR